MSTTTPNLGISHIASNQNQKEVTANTAFDELDTAMTDEQSFSIAAGGTITPTPASVLITFSLKLTGADASTVTFVMPANKHFYHIEHAGSGGHTVTVKVSGQTGVVFQPGDKKLVYCNGTDIFDATNTSGILVASIDLTNQSADIGTTTLYGILASGAGMYRVVGYITTTTVDGATSTRPALQIRWTDKDNSAVQNWMTVAAADASNLLTNATQGQIVASGKASTNLEYKTDGTYASGTPTTMKFAVHLRVYRIG